MDILPYEVKENVVLQGTLNQRVDHPCRAHDLQVFTGHIEEPKNELPFHVLFSSVCQSWKDLVFSTPSLWNTIIITDRTPFDFIMTHLTLSRALPLDLHLLFKDADHNQVIRTIELLRRHVMRWRTFDCRTNVLVGVMLALEGLEAPLLKEFKVHDPFAETFHPADMYRYVTCSIFKGQRSLPRLAAVSLVSMPVKWENHPFSNLKELEIGSLTNDKKPTIAQFRDLLGKSPALEKLTLDGCPIQDFENAPDTLDGITLPALHTMELARFSSCKGLMTTLKLIHAPKVTRLGLTDLTWDDEGQYTDFDEALDTIGDTGRSLEYFRSIKELKIVNVEFQQAEALANMFHELPNLTSLAILAQKQRTDPSRSAEFAALMDIRHIAGLIEKPVACPRLKELVLSGLNPRTLSVLTKARRRMKARLERIFYNEKDDIPDSTIAELQTLGVTAIPCTMPIVDALDFGEEEDEVADADSEGEWVDESDDDGGEDE